MHTVQVVLDEDLLQATDLAAQRARLNRSALVREALKAYLARVEGEILEAEDRKGYELLPDSPEDVDAWERIALWPED